MFVESMTFEELRREFEKDKAPLVRKAIFHSQHVKKIMRQTKATKLDKYYDWLSPNKNRWTYRFDVDFSRGKTANFLVSQYCVFYTEKSYAVVTYAVNIDRLTYFTSHFFTRYFQREHLPVDSIHNIVRTFMIANSTYVAQPLKLKYENEYDSFIQMK